MGYAITTRYAGPTYARGSRVIGTGPALTSLGRPTRATVPWDYAGDADASHRAAAEAVVRKLRAAGWNVYLSPEDRGASLPDDSGRVYVLRYDRE